MINKILYYKHTFVIAGPEFAQQIAGQAVGLAQTRVKTLTGFTSLETAHEAFLQAFSTSYTGTGRDFTALREWLTYHGTLKLLLIFDVRAVSSKNIEWWLDSIESVRRTEDRLVFFTSFDKHARDLMFGSKFLSRAANLGNFLS